MKRNYPATKDALQFFFKANQDEEGKIINTITIHFPLVFNFPIIDDKRIHVMLTY